MYKDLAKQIKALRLREELSQERFGKKIGVSGQSISAYETGRITPKVSTLKTIVKAYNTHLEGFDCAQENKNAKIKETMHNIEKSLKDLKKHLLSL